MRQPVQRVGHFAVAATWPRIEVVWMCGQLRNSGAPARLLVVGEAGWATYLPERLLRPGFRVQPLDHVRGPRLRRLLERHRDEADLLCVRLDRGWARLALGPDYLEVPEWVGGFIDLPDDLEGFFRANESRHSDVRRLRREGYTWEVSHAHADVDFLYRDFHMPHIQRRFGVHAHVGNPWLWHHRLSQGGLLWILHQGRRVGGALYSLEKDCLHLRATGCAADNCARAGFAGIYAFSCMHAHALGIRRIGLGGSRPTVRDGVFGYKRKWGARFVRKADNYFDFHLWWNRPSPALCELLVHTPLAIHDGDSLAHLAQSQDDGRGPKALARELRTAGFARTIILGEGGDDLPAGMTVLNPRAAYSSRDFTLALSASRGSMGVRFADLNRGRGGTR